MTPGSAARSSGDPVSTLVSKSPVTQCHIPTILDSLKPESIPVTLTNPVKPASFHSHCGCLRHFWKILPQPPLQYPNVVSAPSTPSVPSFIPSLSLSNDIEMMVPEGADSKDPYLEPHSPLTAQSWGKSRPPDRLLDPRPWDKPPLRPPRLCLPPGPLQSTQVYHSLSTSKH